MSRIFLVATILFLAAPAMAGKAEGVRAFKAGEYAKAYEELRKVENSGDVEATIVLAGMHMLGLGVDQSREQAKKLYLRAEQHGSPKAAIALSAIYLADNRIENAKTILRKYANHGNAGVALILGSYYESGKHFERNEKKARRWYRIAARNGSQKAGRKLKELEATSGTD